MFKISELVSVSADHLWKSVYQVYRTGPILYNISCISTLKFDMIYVACIGIKWYLKPFYKGNSSIEVVAIDQGLLNGVIN